MFPLYWSVVSNGFDADSLSDAPYDMCLAEASCARKAGLRGETGSVRGCYTKLAWFTDSAMSPGLPINEIGSDSFKASALRVASLAYRIASAFRNSQTAIRFSRNLWRLDRSLKAIQDRFYEASAPPVTPPTKEQLESGVRAIETLQSSFADLATSFKVAGMYNQSLVSTPLMSAMERIDDIAEFAYVVEVHNEPDELAAIDSLFECALEQLRLGETIPAERVF
jgi:hypothetical protein